MTKVLVLYYSSYGHIEQMAIAVAEGARSAGAEVDIRRVPETAPPAVIEAAHFKTDSAHPLIEGPEALTSYDAIVIGAPTRFGRMPSQMASFLDTTGGLWMRGALIGKVGAAFTATGSQHGGQETTLLDHHQPAPFGHGHRRPGLRLSGPDGCRCCPRRFALWRYHGRRR